MLKAAVFEFYSLLSAPPHLQPSPPPPPCLPSSFPSFCLSFPSSFLLFQPLYQPLSCSHSPLLLQLYSTFALQPLYTSPCGFLNPFLFFNLLKSFLIFFFLTQTSLSYLLSLHLLSPFLLFHIPCFFFFLFFPQPPSLSSLCGAFLPLKYRILVCSFLFTPRCYVLSTLLAADNDLPLLL